MTITTTANKVIFQGNSASTVFTWNSFVGATTSDLSVIYTDPQGNQTTLSSLVYTIALTAGTPPTWGVGGTLTYPLPASSTPAIPTGGTLTLLRTLPLTQPTSISNQGQFYAQTVEQAMDQLEMQIQQLSNAYGMAIVGNVADANAPAPLPPIAQRANKSAGFDANGNLVALSSIANTTVSTAMIPVVTAATLAVARTALGLGASAVEALGNNIVDDGSGNLVTKTNGVTLSQIQTIAPNTLIGNNTGVTASAIALTVAQINTMLGGGATGTGTVTSVGLTASTGVFAVTSTPVTTNGTISLTLNNQSMNLILAGPASGAAALPTFRSLVTNDLPGVAGVAGSYGTANSKTTLIESMTLDAKGRITQISFVTGASYGGSGGGGGGGGTCFLYDSMITMANGTRKKIIDIRVGDLVKGDADGQVNTVEGVEHLTLGSRVLLNINREHKTTDEHCHMRPDHSFASMNPHMSYSEWDQTYLVFTKGGRHEHLKNVGLPDGVVSMLRKGQTLQKEDGPVKVRHLDYCEPDDYPPDTPLFNLKVNGSGTYIVDGYVVTGWPNKDRWDYIAWAPKETVDAD